MPPLLESISKIIICLIFILLTSCAGTRPDSIGQFVDCPDKPNCVSTKSDVTSHKVSPLTYKSSLQEAKNKLIKITDKRMTRFNISLQESVEMVLWSLLNSQGGDILVPKIPSLSLIHI